MTYPTSSRRAALTGGLSAIVATVSAPALAAVSGRHNDPVVDLFRQYQRAVAVWEPMEERTETLRLELEAYYEDKPWPTEGYDRYYGNPQLLQLVSDTEALGDKKRDIQEKLLQTPVSSKEGAAAKLRVALDLWGPTESRDEMDYHESQTLEAMEDVIRLLEART